MEPNKRTITIPKPDLVVDVSAKSSKTGYSLLDYKVLNIISIKIKGIEPSDIFFEANITDSWGNHNFKDSKRIYLGDYETEFIEQLGYLVLQTKKNEVFNILVPHRSIKLEFAVRLFNKEIDPSSMEVIINIICFPEEITPIT